MNMSKDIVWEVRLMISHGSLFPKEVADGIGMDINELQSIIKGENALSEDAMERILKLFPSHHRAETIRKMYKKEKIEAEKEGKCHA